MAFEEAKPLGLQVSWGKTKVQFFLVFHDETQLYLENFLL